jgi:hypothetical protein
MAFVLSIGGAAKDIKAGSLRISWPANGRATAAFTVLSTGATQYRPSLDAEVLITQDGDRIFGGLVDRPRESGLLGGKAGPEIATEISAADFNVYAERRYVYAPKDSPIAAGTLKAQLTTLVADYLAVYGVTLDAGQVDGPTMPEHDYNYTQLDDVLNEWATITAKFGEPYVWRIDAFKVLRMYQPSTAFAPWSLSGDALSDVIGDVTVEQSRDKRNANRVIVLVAPQTQLDRVESFTGDGSTTSFNLQYSVLSARGYVTNAGTVESFGDDVQYPIVPGDTTWTLDRTTGVLTTSGAAPGVGETVSFQFDGQFNGTAIAEDVSAATDPLEKVIKLDAVPPDTTIQAIADGELAKSIYPTKTVRYSTLRAGLRPGMAQNITITRRSINTTSVISEISIRDKFKDRLVYDVTCTIDGSQTNATKTYRQTYKQWNADTRGSATMVAPTPTANSGATVGPAAPNRAVQWNNNGAFGGDASFIFYTDENSVICGDACSITAASFESCSINGQDNHITDPA